MPVIFNDATDDIPADALAEGFTGLDTSTKPSRLDAGQLRAGSNMWADVDNVLKTRPALRFCSLLNDTPIVGAFRIQGADYYDIPGTERLLAVRQGKLYELSGAGNNETSTALAGPTYSTTADVAMAQLVDHMFTCDGTLNFHVYAAGWTHGTVTAFSTAAAMPTWRLICAHGFRLLAVESGGHKLYASAVGQASLAAHWIPTDNIRVGSGEGDAIQRLISGQGSNLIVVCERSAWMVDTSATAVANWTVTRITGLTGCVAGKTAISFGQDVLFLSRFGVMSLGALQDTTSINPATSLSAPIQSFINRINWSAIDTAWATAWRDLYIMGVALDADTYPRHLLCYHVRTGKWQAPWSAELGNVDVGLADDAVFSGFSAAVVSRFGVKQETLLGDTTGRLLRIDDSQESDENDASNSQPITSWATLKAFDFETPAHMKQLFYTELEFYRSTCTDCQINLQRDGLQAYPDKDLVDCEIIAAGLSTGNLSGFPVVFPLVFQPNEAYRKSFPLRSFNRCRQASLQFVSVAGRLQLRQAVVSAFIDSPILNQ